MKQLFACAAVAAALAAAVGLSTANGAAGGRFRSHAPATAVRVHGRWTVVVRNRHGRVTHRVRFENSLVGTDILPRLLAGTAAPGMWQIAVDEGPFGGLTPAPVTSNHVAASGTPVLELRAALPITTTGTIGAVSTWLRLCGGVSPTQCQSPTSFGTDFEFTSKGGLSVPVTAGDSVSFTVKISLTVPSSTRFADFPLKVLQLLDGLIVPKGWTLALHLDNGWPSGTSTTVQALSSSLQLGTAGVYAVAMNPTAAPTTSQGAADLAYCASPTLSVADCQSSTQSASSVRIVFDFPMVTVHEGQEFVIAYTLSFS